MSTLTIEGKVIKLLPEQSGENSKGGWKRNDIIIETPGEYSKQVHITVYDTIKTSLKNELEIGDSIKVDFSIQSREYKDKWYTSATAHKIERF
jgi:hypothetical protein